MDAALVITFHLLAKAGVVALVCVKPGVAALACAKLGAVALARAKPHVVAALQKNSAPVSSDTVPYLVRNKALPPTLTLMQLLWQLKFISLNARL